MKTTDVPPQAALAGIRVLDCATFVAGPYCATFFAEFGAEVIKIELPKVGDPTRKFGTPTSCGDSLVWLSEGRNKKSLTIDLRKPEGSELLKKLVIDSDILIENFQPGTFESWGLSWDELKKYNPQLIMVRISAYGQTGPMSPQPGFGRIANAFGGISYLSGYSDRPPVSPGSATLADYLSGMYASMGAFVALKAREHTQEGQVVDVALYESIFRILDELAPAYHFSGFVRERMGAGAVNVVPHSHYPTKDGKWIAIACTGDKIFARLAKLMGCPEFSEDGKWGTVEQRVKDRIAVDAHVTSWTSQLNRDQLLSLCIDGQVPCGPINSIAEIFEDPQFIARKNIAYLEEKRISDDQIIAVANVVPKLSATPGKINWLGPKLGQDSDEILSTLLKLSPIEIKELRDKDVI